MTTKKTKSLPVDYLCVLDLEATCTAKGCPNPQEIIEFPTLLFNTQTCQIESVFHHYIKPDIHPTLSPFCTNLTGITQSMTDSGILIQQALLLHAEWLEECGVVPLHLAEESSGVRTFLYVTCGDWDLASCLPKQLEYHNRTVPSNFSHWINIKHAYSGMYRAKAGGMTQLLRNFGLKLEGRHHSGIDDCKNIARCCEAMINDGWRPTRKTFHSRGW